MMWEESPVATGLEKRWNLSADGRGQRLQEQRRTLARSLRGVLPKIEAGRGTSLEPRA